MSFETDPSAQAAQDGGAPAYNQPPQEQQQPYGGYQQAPQGYQQPPQGYQQPPPGYQNAGYQGQPAYQVPPQGYGAAPAYAPPPAAAAPAPIVVNIENSQNQKTNAGTPLLAGTVWGEVPVRCKCSACGNDITTNVKLVAGTLPWLVAGGLVLIGCWLGCCLIPFAVDSLKDVVHSCPACNAVLGKKTRM